MTEINFELLVQQLADKIEAQQTVCFGVATNFPVMLYDPFDWTEFLRYCNTPCSKYEVNDDKFPY